MSSYSDAGLFGVLVQTTSGQEGDVLRSVYDELAALAQKPLSDAELHGARLRLKQSILLGAEPVDQRAHFYARQALFTDKVLCRTAYAERADAVSAQDVQQFVAKMLKGTPTLVSEGDSANYPSIFKLRQ